MSVRGRNQSTHDSSWPHLNVLTDSFGGRKALEPLRIGVGNRVGVLYNARKIDAENLARGSQNFCSRN